MIQQYFLPRQLLIKTQLCQWNYWWAPVWKFDPSPLVTTFYLKHWTLKISSHDYVTLALSWYELWKRIRLPIKWGIVWKVRSTFISAFHQVSGGHVHDWETLRFVTCTKTWTDTERRGLQSDMKHTLLWGHLTKPVPLGCAVHLVCSDSHRWVNLSGSWSEGWKYSHQLWEDLPMHPCFLFLFF